jgi:hypothetical protein
MAEVFTKKSSFSLLKTNPKLTGNVKLVVDSKGDIYIETIDGSIELSRNKYKGKKLDINNSWASDVYNLFNGGNIPKSLFYALKDDERFFSVKDDISKQYYTNYQQGAYPKVSKLYSEQIAYFVPTWFEPNNIPEYFAIFKVPNPVSVNTKNLENSFDLDTEKQIYNTNYFETIANPTGFGATESSYFFETILKDSNLHKVYDLGRNSTIGTYLRNHLLDKNFPESSLTVNWSPNEITTVNGISLQKSGFTKEGFRLFDEAFPVDRTVTEFDKYITSRFEELGVVHPNIINIEFLFDDEEDSEYTINRYFGVYFNREDISKFKLDPIAFYEKKYDNLPQNKDILGIDTINILDDKNIVLENDNGVKLLVDYKGNYEVKSSDVKGQNFIPYIYSTDETFYKVNNNIDWGTNEIILHDKVVSSNQFKGFEKDSSGIINAVKTNKEGRSYFEFSMDISPNSLELRLRNTNEFSSKFDLNRVFVGDIGLTQGEFSGNKFSLSGTPDVVMDTLSKCINSYAETDEDFNIYSISKGNKLIVFTRGTNAYWNNYDFLIYSNDTLFFDNTEVNFGEKIMRFSEFNANRISAFKDYNELISGSPMYHDPNASIIQSNFKGGNYNSGARVRVKKEDFEYFSTDKFLRTKYWFTPITSICSYLDEPIYQNGRIVDFDNYNDYISINTLDDIFVSDGAFIEVYSVGTNKFGIMSIFPIKQFDVDQFRSDYSRKADGHPEKISKFTNINFGIMTSISGPSAADIVIFEKEIANLKSDIQESLKQLQFKTLAGLPNEVTGDIPYIENEYDRLSENELSQLSIDGRIIPYINKWVYDDEGTDVRDNNYRMSTNSAFSFDNFSPSTKNRLPNPKFFTHEWYYLGKYPNFLSVDERVDTFSYFQDNLYLGSTGTTGLYSIQEEDYFTNYFTQYKVEDNDNNVRFFPKRYKYSVLSGGNDTSYSETFFRGAKIKAKRRVDNTEKLNFNIGDIPVYPSEEFNDYKFSAVLQTDVIYNPPNIMKSKYGAPDYKVIENKKHRTITFVITADLFSFDTTFNPSTGGGPFLDRANLYTLQHKIQNPISNGPSNSVYADVQLSGAIIPFVRDNNRNIISTYTYDNTKNEYTLTGFENLTNSSIPSFESQISPSDNGTFNEIIVKTGPNSELVIRGIQAVTNNQIIVKKSSTTSGVFHKIGLTEYPLPTSGIHNGTMPLPEQISGVVPVYIQGGYNYFEGILPDLSFAAIFDKVNNGSPDIQYITINEDGTIDKDTFILEFDEPTINAKADYIKTDKLVFSGLKNNDYKPIGSKLVGMENTLFIPMFRYNGSYNPKFTNIVYFRETGEDLGSYFNSDIRNDINLKNTQFFSTYPNFGLYRQLYYNKVNELNPLSVIELSSTSALNPEYWKISEIALDRRDMYIFRSNWDLNYYRRYKLKNTFINLPGYVDSKEVSSFLASTIMNIPDTIKLEKYIEGKNLIINRNDNVVQGVLQNSIKLVSTISPGIDYLFQEYVNEKFNYRKLDTFEDDKDRYIKENILSRYILDGIVAYIKYSNKNSGANIIESNMTEQELIQNGFIRLENINFKQVSLNDFDFEFTFNKPSDKAVTLAFITKIIVE